MRINKSTVIGVIALFPFFVVVAQSTIIDTISYYEQDENELFWIDDCFFDGYCEPVAIQFDQGDIPTNAVKIEKIRFKIAEPGVFRSVLYSGGDIPLPLNIVWDDSINVNTHEVDNTDTNAVSPWKEIDFNQPIESLILNFPIWFQIDIKSYSLGFSGMTIDPESPSHSFTGWMIGENSTWYRADGTEFISELIVSYSTSSNGRDSEIPKEYKVDDAYPNPFNHYTNIYYELPVRSNVSLSILNIQGRIIQTLVSKTQATGNYEAQWNGTDNAGKLVSTGVYLARFQAGDYSKVIKLVYLR